MCVYHTLAHELYQHPEKSKQYIRMSKAQFDHTDVLDTDMSSGVSALVIG